MTRAPAKAIPKTADLVRIHWATMKWSDGAMPTMMMSLAKATRACAWYVEPGWETQREVAMGVGQRASPQRPKVRVANKVAHQQK